MSRVGKLPVPLPKGVEVNVAGETVSVKGPLGTLTQPLTGDDCKVVFLPQGGCGAAP